MPTYALVYQVGIANVFKYIHNRQSATRIVQHAYTYCETFAAGLLEAGCTVEVRHCDKAGDITSQPWPVGRGEIFLDRKSPPAKAMYADD
jgi:hypothetical protein